MLQLFWFALFFSSFLGVRHSLLSSHIIRRNKAFFNKKMENNSFFGGFSNKMIRRIGDSDPGKLCVFCLIVNFLPL